MLKNDTHTIAVAAEQEQGRVFLAAVTTCMIFDTVAHHERRFNISTRPPGTEIIFDEDENLLQNSMAADAARKSYSLLTAMQSPERIPDSLSLSVCTETRKQFCGRVLFRCCDAVPSFQADAVLLLLREEELEQIPDGISSAKGICVGIQCRTLPAEQQSAEELVKKRQPSLYDTVKNRYGAFYWYHPKGFRSDGTVQDEENAVPYGIPEIFWGVSRIAAEVRKEYLHQQVMENKALIQKRNSFFQQSSPRRVLELNRARAAYAAAVQSLYGTEQLLAAAIGSPLAEDEKKGVTLRNEI